MYKFPSIIYHFYLLIANKPHFFTIHNYKLYHPVNLVVFTNFFQMLQYSYHQAKGKRA